VENFLDHASMIMWLDNRNIATVFVDLDVTIFCCFLFTSTSFWAIPFNIHTPLLTRLLIFDPFGNGFWEDPSEICYFSRNPLGNFRFFSSPSEILVDEVPSRKTPSEIFKFLQPLRKFCIIFLPPQKQTLLTRLLVFYPLGNLRFSQDPSEILVEVRDPFGNFQIFITPSEILYNFLTASETDPVDEVADYLPPRKFRAFPQPLGNVKNFCMNWPSGYTAICI
jgi:hypothetical protein